MQKCFLLLVVVELGLEELFEEVSIGNVGQLERHLPVVIEVLAVSQQQSASDILSRDRLTLTTQLVLVVVGHQVALDLTEVAISLVVGVNADGGASL